MNLTFHQHFTGHDRFANMMRIYYRDSHGAVVVCDCSKKDTITGAFRWKKDLDYKLSLDNGEPIPAILLANKVSLFTFLTITPSSV
jgi:signal recognition particle receptor subunit beta